MLLRLLTRKASAAEYSLVHQINETHVAIVKRIMASRCASLFRLHSKLLVCSEPLLENVAPIEGQIFDRMNGEPGLLYQLEVSRQVIQICDCMPCYINSLSASERGR